jgi:hypothetical protein
LIMSTTLASFTSAFVRSLFIMAMAIVAIVMSSINLVNIDVNAAGQWYTCPAGQLLQGDKCVVANKYQAVVGYTCPRGGELQGNNCVATGGSPVDAGSDCFVGGVLGSYGTVVNKCFKTILVSSSEDPYIGNGTVIAASGCNVSGYGDNIFSFDDGTAYVCTSTRGWTLDWRYQGPGRTGRNNGWSYIHYASRMIVGNYIYPATPQNAWLCPAGWNDAEFVNCWQPATYNGYVLDNGSIGQLVCNPSTVQVGGKVNCTATLSGSKNGVYHLENGIPILVGITGSKGDGNVVGNSENCAIKGSTLICNNLSIPQNIGAGQKDLLVYQNGAGGVVRTVKGSLIVFEPKSEVKSSSSGGNSSASSSSSNSSSSLSSSSSASSSSSSSKVEKKTIPVTLDKVKSSSNCNVDTKITIPSSYSCSFGLEKIDKEKEEYILPQNSKAITIMEDPKEGEQTGQTEGGGCNLLNVQSEEVSLNCENISTKGMGKGVKKVFLSLGDSKGVKGQITLEEGKPQTKEDSNQLLIQCNGTLPVEAESRVECSFGLPQGKILPDVFRMAIGEGVTPSGICSMVNNMAVCKEVPVINNTGIHPIFIQIAQDTPVDTMDRINVVSSTRGSNLVRSGNITNIALFGNIALLFLTAIVMNRKIQRLK